MQDMVTMESVLIKAADILHEHEIQYWVTDGTLLGLIRENRILPWDSDLDLGVWKEDVSIPDIIRIFRENGFEYLEVLPDMDSLHFGISGIQLDINLYTEKSGETSVKWATNLVRRLDRLSVQAINIIFEGQKNIRVSHAKEINGVGLIKSLLQGFGRLLTENFRENIFDYARSRYVYIGSAYPSELFEFTTFVFKGCELNVPINSDEYLRLTYGDDWKTPNREYAWETDTCNLKVFD